MTTSVTLSSFLSSNWPGWENRSADLINQRLERLGRQRICLAHRNRSSFYGVPQHVVHCDDEEGEVTEDGLFPLECFLIIQ
ncbi:unnamed protein product [Caenorhabditis nigoni]